MPFNIATFRLVHVVLSVVGLLAGLVVVGGLIAGRRLFGWTGLFLVTTVLTNLPGFGFPVSGLIASHYVGAISLVILPFVAAALYWKHLDGAWRKVFVVGSVVALYLNVFVLVTQLFRKVPAMIVLAPTQKEPPFAVTHLLVLAMFAWMGRAAWKGFAAQPGFEGSLRPATEDVPARATVTR